jgi:uncharacterized protein YwqG
MNAGNIPKDRDGFRVMLEKKVGASFAQRIVPWALPAIGLHDRDLGDEPSVMGTTRFGGRPDLPNSVSWPIGPHGPLAFLGQIALHEVHPFDICRVLPRSGMLTFFFNIEDYAWGISRKDRQRFEVLYFPSDTTLRRRDFPETIVPVNRVQRVRQVIPYLRWNLPRADPLAQEVAGFLEEGTWGKPATEPFTISYWGLDDELTKPHIPLGNHQLLGWANGIYQQQEDCRLMCARSQLDFPERGTPEYAKALEERRHWRCLLQIGDDVKLYNDGWADGGTIAFMIREDDLAQRRFDACWCILSSS